MEIITGGFFFGVNGLIKARNAGILTDNKHTVCISPDL